MQETNRLLTAPTTPTPNPPPPLASRHKNYVTHTTDQFHVSDPKVSVKVAKVERFMRIDRYDEAYLAFDIDADLTSAFSWQGVWTYPCVSSPKKKKQKKPKAIFLFAPSRSNVVDTD